MDRIEVYLCDDVAALRLVVRTVLELEPSITVVGEAGDGEVAIQELGRLRPDVLVLDLSLPGRDGLEILEVMPDLSPRTKVIVFSGYPRGPVAESALARGAKRYLEKGVDMDAVVAAVLEVAAEASP
ncbi:MAG TPA: response regulator transcription factor [Gaiellaceae bacterium]|nr:response regulator transcription factor [Gaiellaceae bacterium]